MVKIDFNNSSFNGFEDGEDILVDSGVILAYLHEYDAWHKTVGKLFDSYNLNTAKMFYYM